MTREERAKKYAEEAFAKALKAPWPEAQQVFAEAYMAGAKDADSNPAWRMCEELPYPNEDVLVAFDNGDRGIGYYEGIGDWYVNGIGVVDNIAAWLPLPKFNPKSK